METIIIIIVIIVIAFLILALGILLSGKLLEAGIENKYGDSDNYWEELPQELLEEVEQEGTKEDIEIEMDS